MARRTVTTARTELAGRLANCPSPGGIFADSVADVRPLDDPTAGLEL